MSRCLRYPNARSAAYAVKRQLEAQGWRGLTVRPFNMYDPDNTLWWIVPHSDWPAFRYGKLCFYPERAISNSLFCGLNVEKGLPPSVAPAYPSAAGQRFIMKTDWTWFDFLKDVDSGKLRSALERASTEAASPAVIRFEAGVAKDPGSSDSQPNQPRRDTVIFRTSGSSLTLEIVETPSGLLDELANSHALEDLKRTITQIPSPNWLWLDVFLGFVFRSSSAVSDPDAWDARQLWSMSLSVWEPWFK